MSQLTELIGFSRRERAARLLQDYQNAICVRTDRMFAGLMLAQWLAAIIMALTISPLTWAGSVSSYSAHLVAAVLLGGLLTVLPVLLVAVRPGSVVTRFVVATAQMMMSGLLIHLSNGRIETHFHIFGSLAFLMFYRDWRVYIPATLVVVADHLLRGIYFPLSVYGAVSDPLLRTLEHGWWVIFENAFLIYACVQSQREMREMADRRAELERTVAAMTHVIDNVRVTGIQVTGVSAQISATAKQQQAQATEQAAVSSEILATSREISATSRELAHTMGTVASSADRTAQVAEQGNSALQQMQAGIKQMVGAAHAIAEKLTVLSDKAKNIGGVVTTITRVADQTNLLSLNAAIEAEKAGEHARGFSVVASEIRRLADQTALATLDIERIVQEMQASVTVGVMAMDRFREEVSQNDGLVTGVVDQLSDIIRSVHTMTSNFDQVSEGMRSQSEGAEQISVSIGQMNEAAQQTAYSVREFNGVVQKLHDATDQLQHTVSSYNALNLDSK